MSDRPQQNSSGRGSRASAISVVAGREDVQGTDQPIAHASFRVNATLRPDTHEPLLWTKPDSAGVTPALR